MFEKTLSTLQDSSEIHFNYTILILMVKQVRRNLFIDEYHIL
nr:MAG TPA: hypothetical protein [Caudoviricetes sp.]